MDLGSSDRLAETSLSNEGRGPTFVTEGSQASGKQKTDDDDGMDDGTDGQETDDDDGGTDDGTD